MIIGIVAQENIPPPRGTVVPNVFAHDDVIFSVFVRSGLDQPLFPAFVPGDDATFSYELPVVLMSDAFDSLFDERIFEPHIMQDQYLHPLFYISADSIPFPDVRFPGKLAPPFHTFDDDLIYPVRLILPHGVLLAETYYDPDLIPTHGLDAPRGIYPPTFTDADSFMVPVVKSGIVVPKLIVHDDVVYTFLTTQTGYKPSFYIDDAALPIRETAFDYQTQFVTLTNSSLTVTKSGEEEIAGARTAIFKTNGKWYFEIEVGKSTLAENCCGIVLDVGNYENMALGSNCSVVFFKHNTPSEFLANGNWVGGPIRSNGANWTGMSIGYINEGDIVSIAVNLDDHLIWFRVNGGPWNSKNAARWQGQPIPNQGADPSLSIGGASVAGGRWSPAVLMGSNYYYDRYGSQGQRQTGGFGAAPFRYTPPVGFTKWEMAPIFPPPGPDRFGSPMVGIPTQLDNGHYGVSASADFLTITHVNTSLWTGARSSSLQNWGKYYFEVTVGAVFSPDDALGIGNDPNFDNPQNDYMWGTSVYTQIRSNGTMWCGSQSFPNTTTAFVPGDVLAIAIDLTNQNLTSGGHIWVRKKSPDGTISNWNNLGPLSDPATDKLSNNIGGAGNYSLLWSPSFQFGQASQPGGFYTANFGQNPFVMAKPNGFAVWPQSPTRFVQSLQPPMLDAGEQIYLPMCDMQNRTLYHPVLIAPADDAFFSPRFTGGNFTIIPPRIDDVDDIKRAGYLAIFDGTPTPGVTVSNAGKTVTTTSATGSVAVGVSSLAFQHAGKYYVEFTINKVTGGSSPSVGLLGTKKTMANMNAGTGAVMAFSNGNVYSNNGNQNRNITQFQNGDIIGIAVDFLTRRAWFTKNGGPWNGGTDTPVTPIGGVAIEDGLSFAPAVCFTNGGAADAITMNAGASPYFAQPPGFEGWPGSTTNKYLDLPFIGIDDDYLPARLSPSILYAGKHTDIDAFYLLTGSGGQPTLGPSFVDDSLTDSFYPIPLIVAPVTSLEDIQTYSTLLSNNNLTATKQTTISQAGSRSIAFKTTGKYYFEVTMVNVHGAFDCAGLMLPAATYYNLVNNAQNCVVVYRNNGNVFSNNTNSNKSVGTIAIGDTVGFAVDLTNRKTWVRKNGGLWNGLPLNQESPLNNFGGAVLPATIGFAPAVGFGGSGTAHNDQITINFGGTAYQTPAPAGFSNWGFGSEALATLTLVDSFDTSLSNGNLTATHVLGNGNTGIRTNQYAPGSKIYFEATTDQQLTALIGILTTGAGYQTAFTYGSNTCSIYTNTGNILGPAAGGKTLGGMTAGTVIGFAFDLINRLFWIRKNQGGLGTLSTWNNDALADPATGVGGLPIFAASQYESFDAMIAWNSSDAGKSVTMNFGQNTYNMPVPAGYGKWVISR